MAWLTAIEDMLNTSLLYIHTDYGTDFENSQFLYLCREISISHNISSPEHHNRTKWLNTRTEPWKTQLLIANGLPKRFWTEALSSGFYIQNRVYLKRDLDKISYELLRGRKSDVSHLLFGCKCTFTTFERTIWESLTH